MSQSPAQALASFQALFQSERGIQLLQHLSQVINGLRGIAECLQSDPIPGFDLGLMQNMTAATGNVHGNMNPGMGMSSSPLHPMHHHQTTTTTTAHHVHGNTKKKVKDPLAPKPPMSSYLLFCGSERSKVKDALPVSDQKAVAVELGRRWKLLTDDEKRPFEDEARRLREKYNEDVAEYQKSKVLEANNLLMSQTQPEPTISETVERKRPHDDDDGLIDDGNEERGQFSEDFEGAKKAKLSPSADVDLYSPQHF